MVANEKIPVSERALIQRINRKLARDEKKLCTYRGGKWESDLGHYYVIDVNRNHTVWTHLDLETCGRELEVLKPWEALEVPKE